MRIIFTILISLYTIGFINCQTDAHYWSHQFGAHGLLLNGAVISSAHDETSIFYNPGAISLDGNLGFAFSFISPTYSNLNVDNFLGNNQNLADNGFGFSPGFLAVRFRPFKTEKFVVGVASFKRFSSDITFEDRIIDNIDPTNQFVFRSDLKFNRKRDEDWYGIAFGYKISDKLGIGLSQFSVWHNQSLDLDFTKEILSSLRPESLLLSWRSSFDYDVDISAGWISKIGLSYVDTNFAIGVTVTSQLYSVIESSANYTVDDQRINTAESSFLVVSNRESLGKSVYKSPLSLGLGFNFKLSDYRIFASAEYFNKINPYTLFTDSSDTFDGITVQESNYTINLTTGNERVVNVALGLEYFKNEKITYLGGFRTDFNQNNNLLINETAEYLSSSPNVFHISGGVLATYGSNVFSLGADIAYGKRSGGQQLTDLTNVTSENIFTFSGEDSVNSEFFALSIFLTYDFIFDKIANGLSHQH